MKTFPLYLVLAVVQMTAVALAQDQLLLDDTWADAGRTEMNPPGESAWFASSAISTPTLSASAGALTGHIRLFETNAGSRLWLTHFTTAGAPASLNPGDTLKLTLHFQASNITAAPATVRGMRIGLFNFSAPGASRVAADGFSTGSGGGAPGANVPGYILNMNFAREFTTAGPLQIMKRTDLANVNLMGASSAFSALGSGGGTAGSAGFREAVPYTLEFSATRLETGVEVTTRFADEEGWSISHTVLDSTDPTMQFDTLAMRPNGAADTADAFVFTRFRVELKPFTTRITGIAHTDAGVNITWASMPGRTYEVQVRSTLDAAESWAPLVTVPSEGSSTTFLDIEAPFYERRFYRIVEVAAP